jgi:hypothetical protein
MGSGERDGKRESFNGAAEGNGDWIDANFTNSHELTRTLNHGSEIRAKLVQFVSLI